MHTGYHRRRSWETRFVLALAVLPPLLLGLGLALAWGAPTALAGTIATATAGQILLTWATWAAKP